MTTAIILSDKPQEQTDRTTIEFIIDDPATVSYVQKLNHHYHGDLASIQNHLMRFFKHYRSDYLPVKYHDHVAGLCPQANQLIGFHEALYNAQHFEHQPLNLFTKVYPD